MLVGFNGIVKSWKISIIYIIMCLYTITICLVILKVFKAHIHVVWLKCLFKGLLWPWSFYPPSFLTYAFNCSSLILILFWNKIDRWNLNAVHRFGFPSNDISSFCEMFEIVFQFVWNFSVPFYMYDGEGFVF